MLRSCFTYLCLLLCVLSCKKGETFDCFKQNGEEVTELRYPGPFTTIKVFDKIEMTLVSGSEYKVELRAGHGVIKNISTMVSNGELIIDNVNTCNFVRNNKKKIKALVTVPYIRHIENWGVGNFYIDRAFLQDSVRVRAESSGDIHVEGNFSYIATSSNGNGDIYLDGASNELHVYMYGTNFLYAKGLSVRNAIYVETVSMGDCFVNASLAGRLESKIWKNGNIYYKGSPPEINSAYENNCVGRLIRQD